MREAVRSIKNQRYVEKIRMPRETEILFSSLKSNAFHQVYRNRNIILVS